jgi:hypothetical protein
MFRLLGPLLLLISMSGWPKAPAPHDCPSGEHWVRAHKRKAYRRADGTFVKASNVAAHCQGNPASYQYWQPKLKAGLPAGWRENEKSRPWVVEEQERVLEALDSIPEVLQPKTIEGIYRLQRDGSGSPNPGASQKGKIILYDTVFGSKADLPRVLAHELTHELFRGFTPTEITDYAAAGGWFEIELFKEKMYMRGRPKNTFVEQDGWTKIDEDFSNNVEYFLFQPEALKKTTPKVYDWIKKKYGDKLKLERGSTK